MLGDSKNIVDTQQKTTNIEHTHTKKKKNFKKIFKKNDLTQVMPAPQQAVLGAKGDKHNC